MLPARRTTTHPGEMLRQEFLEPLRLTQADLARAIGVPQNRINELVQGKRGITPETALLLSEYFGNSAEFWMNLQSAHDLTKVRLQLWNKQQGKLKIRGKSRRRISLSAS